MHLHNVPSSFPRTLRKALGYLTVIAVTVQLSGVQQWVHNIIAPAIAADTYLMYAVQDSGGSDSQFFTLKPDVGTATALGPEYPSHDIEGIDVHPTTGELFALAGGGGGQDGKLYRVDRQTGALTPIGDTGATGSEEIVSASFRPDGTLWAFQEDAGIVTVNLANGALTLAAAAGAGGVGNNWEGLAWNTQGTLLYGAEGKKLYRWDPATQTAEKICENLPNPTEALDFRPDGKLFGGWHNAADAALSIFEINPADCTITPTDYDIPYRDVESIAFVIEEPALECNMVIEKVGTPGEVKPGDVLTYVVRIENTGDANCTGGGVELKEFYDPQTAFVTSNPSPLQGDNLWNFDVVEPEEEHLVVITVKVSADAQPGDILTNRACVWAEQQGNHGDDDAWKCATATTPVITPPPGGVCELTLLKTASAEEVAPGDMLGYTVTLKNTGDANCTGGGVELKEFYDPQTTFVSATPTPLQSNNLWNFDVVEPEEEHTVAITVTVSPQAQDGDMLTNKACAWAEQFGPKTDEDNWVCTSVTTLVRIPPPQDECRLQILKTDNPDPVMPGADLAYEVKVTNTGDATCTDVTLEEEYDAQTTFVSSTPAPDVGDAAWDLGTLAPQQATTVAIMVRVGNTAQNGDTLINTACAAALEFGTSEVCDEEETSVVTLPPSTPLLTITKKVSDADETLQDENTTVQSAQMTYTVELKNNGTGGASDVVLTDDYDEQRVTVTDAIGGTDDDTKIVYPVGVINPGQTVTKQIIVMVKSGFATTTVFDNLATATASNHATVSDHVTTTVVVPPAAPALTLLKRVSDTDESLVKHNTINAGGMLTYTINIANVGNATATDVVLVDDYDEDAVTITNDGGASATTTTLEFLLGALSPGQTVTKLIQAEVDAALSGGVFANHAILMASNHATLTDAATTTVVIVPTGFDLALEKSVSPGTLTTNQETTFTITVANEGSVAGTGITVKDVLPSQLVYVSDTGGGAYNPGNGIWTIGNLSLASTTELKITVRASSSGSFTNVAEMATADQTDVDSTPNNNIATEDDQDSASVQVNELPGPPGGCPLGGCPSVGGSPPFPRIVIEKSVSKSVVTPGEIITYTFTVRAQGTETAQNVRIQDSLPMGFTFIETSTSGRVWDFGSMQAATSRAEQYDVLVGAQVTPGTYENVVIATITNGASPDNRSEARAKVEVRAGGGGGTPASPSLTIVKTATSDFTNPGSEVIYNVTVKNVGGSVATRVRFEDALPSGFTFVQGGTGIKEFVLGDLAPGELRTHIYTAAVSADASTGFYRNVATARADNATPVMDDAVVEVRIVEVKGFTTLPDTGTGVLNPLMAAWVSFFILAAGGLLAYRYRNTLRERSRAQLAVNLLLQE